MLIQNTYRVLCILATVPVLAITGCSLSSPMTGSATVPVTSTSVIAIQGHIHGGQQPVSGAAIQLYAASKTGYGTASLPLISATVKSDVNGFFSITGDYPTCQPSDLVYIVAIGGNPGIAGTQNNSALAMMAGLGRCDSLTSSTFIQINELTTVASVWALSPFMSDLTHVATSSTNVQGLTNAFAAVNEIVNTSTGTVPGPFLPTGATLPVDEINTLADILAVCINTVDSTSPVGQSSSCNSVFSASKTVASTPTNTIQAALDLAQNPALGLTLSSLVSGQAPFQPTLTAAPNSWVMAINYAAGLAAPAAIGADSKGNLFVPNAGSNSITKLTTNGVWSTFGVGLNSPSAIAIDLADNVWIANVGNSTVSEYTTAGVASTILSNGLNSPRAIAIDAGGNIWVANSGNSTVSEFSSTGAALSSGGFSSGGINQPVGIAIDPK